MGILDAPAPRLLAVVEHGAIASTARPKAERVLWVGSIEPTNRQAGDLYFVVTGEPAPITVFADSFTRADGALGSTPTGGKPWTVAGAGAVGGIVSNVAKLTTVGAVAGTIYVDALVADGTYTIKLAAVGSAAQAVVAFRFADTDNYLGLARVSGTDFHYRVTKAVAATVTTIATLTPLMTDGDVIAIHLNGSAVQIDINSVNVYTGTITEHATATKFGFRSSSTSPTFDDVSFVAGA